MRSSLSIGGHWPGGGYFCRLDAVQSMRRRAQQAGNLKTTPQESVTTQGNSIVIEPSDPQVVYVPEYDP